MAYYFSYNTKGLYPILQGNLPSNILDNLYSESKLHCTMLYSNGEYQKPYGKLKLPEVESTITEFSIWETFPGFVLVARLEDKELQEFHSFIKETFSLTHGNENFNPHITLQKADSREDLIPMEKLEFLIGQKVTLNSFRCIPIRNR